MSPVWTRAHSQIYKKKKKLVGIYKFKKYGFAKVPTLIFVLEKKIKGNKSIKITANNLNNPKL